MALLVVFALHFASNARGRSRRIAWSGGFCSGDEAGGRHCGQHSSACLHSGCPLAVVDEASVDNYREDALFHPSHNDEQERDDVEKGADESLNKRRRHPVRCFYSSGLHFLPA